MGAGPIVTPEGTAVAIGTNGPTVVRIPNTQTTDFGTLGFVFAIMCNGVPFLGWAVWILSIVFCVKGLRRGQRGFSIAGLVIDFFAIIILIVMTAAFATLIASI